MRWAAWLGQRSARQRHRFVGVPEEETKQRTLSDEVSEHNLTCRATDLPWTVEQQGTPVDHSYYSAGNTTYLKIVMAALIAGNVVVNVAILVRLRSDDGGGRSARMTMAREVVAITRSSGNPVQ